MRQSPRGIVANVSLQHRPIAPQDFLQSTRDLPERAMFDCSDQLRENVSFALDGGGEVIKRAGSAGCGGV